MEISATHENTGDFTLEIGPVTFSLNIEAVQSLYKIIDERLGEGDDKERLARSLKLKAYRALASKMVNVDERVLQKFANQVKTEQLVTLVRLAEGEALYNKVLENMSRQNRRQFEEDFAAMERITEHQAIVFMEQIIPVIKQAAQDQKRQQLQDRVGDLN